LRFKCEPQFLVGFIKRYRLYPGHEFLIDLSKCLLPMSCRLATKYQIVDGNSQRNN
jgi:hypothetical protein